jgi:hypothetical protein
VHINKIGLPENKPRLARAPATLVLSIRAGFYVP